MNIKPFLSRQVFVVFALGVNLFSFELNPIALG